MFQGRQALPTNNLSNPFSPNDSVAGNHPQKTVLQYPLDIGGSPNQGHFVLFKIKKQQPGELKKNGQGGVKTSASENAVNGVTGEIVSSQGGGGATVVMTDKVVIVGIWDKDAVMSNKQN